MNDDDILRDKDGNPIIAEADSKAGEPIDALIPLEALSSYVYMGRGWIRRRDFNRLTGVYNENDINEETI